VDLVKNRTYLAANLSELQDKYFYNGAFSKERKEGVAWVGRRAFLHFSFWRGHAEQISEAIYI